jgi:hypothetical protein
LNDLPGGARFRPAWHFSKLDEMNKIHHKAEKYYSLFIDGFRVLARELQLINRV